MREARRRERGRRLGRCHADVGARADQALHVVELPGGRLGNRGQGQAAGPHLGSAGARRPGGRPQGSQRPARRAASLRPRAGNGSPGSLIANAALRPLNARSSEEYPQAPSCGEEPWKREEMPMRNLGKLLVCAALAAVPVTTISTMAAAQAPAAAPAPPPPPPPQMPPSLVPALSVDLMTAP